MIRNLYVNEELIVSLNNKRLIGMIKKEHLSKSINSDQIKFIRDYPDVMRKLKEGNELQITTNGVITKSSIEDKIGEGFTVPASIGDLDDKISGRRL